MPDLQRVVSDMLAKGASLDDVRRTLSEMGVGDETINELLAQNKGAAEQESEGAAAQQPAQAGKRRAVQRDDDEEMSLLELGKERSESASGAAQSTPQSADETTFAEISKKLEEILAAVKGIQELDRKLLEANRDLALKIKTSQ